MNEMNETAILVENLGKMYRVGAVREQSDFGRQLAVDIFLSPFKRLVRLLRGEASGAADMEETFWALKNVSFDVRRGEVVGIIGRNGAGKSTVLKILSRITTPTEGRGEIMGRVGSILEVGTGFHPELTGRENILLNGAILGMRRTEIRGKLSEIVAFAGIEKFVDTPVKYYSSGMFVRLAFSVASHLETEILFVDEVLSVGDLNFQDRCLKKMDNISKTGRTILFVSHNMNAVANLCGRVIWLHNGSVLMDGPARKVVEEYISSCSQMKSKKKWEVSERPGNKAMELVSVAVLDARGCVANKIRISEGCIIEIEFEIKESGSKAQFSLVVFNGSGVPIMGSLSNREKAFYGKPMGKGRYRARCNIYGNLLNSGTYYVTIVAASQYWTDRIVVEHSVAFEAIDDGALRGDYYGDFAAAVRPELVWTTTRADS